MRAGSREPAATATEPAANAWRFVPADEYRSLVETVYLLRSPRNAERLRESVAEFEAGEAEVRDLLT